MGGALPRWGSGLRDGAVEAESSGAGGVAPPPREAERVGVVVAGVTDVSTGASPRSRTGPGDGALAAELRALDEEREDAPAPAEHWGSGEENDATGRGGAEFCGRDPRVIQIYSLDQIWDDFEPSD